MALITCPDCGKDISENSQQCIHCGAPISGSPKDATSGVSGGKLFAIIAVGVAVGIFAWQFLIQSPAIVSGFKEGYQEQKALSTLAERGVQWKESKRSFNFRAHPRLSSPVIMPNAFGLENILLHQPKSMTSCPLFATF